MEEMESKGESRERERANCDLPIEMEINDWDLGEAS